MHQCESFLIIIISCTAKVIKHVNNLEILKCFSHIFIFVVYDISADFAIIITCLDTIFSCLLSPKINRDDIKDCHFVQSMTKIYLTLKINQ